MNRLYWILLALCAFTWANVFLRYIVTAGLVSLVTRFVPQRRIQRWTSAETGRRRAEFMASMRTVLIFTAVAIVLLFGDRYGWPKLYRQVDLYGYAYLPVSFILAVVMHDAYFYWTHRLLHHRWFVRFHGEHHKSVTPTVWAGFAFHPLEALVQAGIYPILVFCLPMHFVVMSAFLAYSALFTAIIHSGYDLSLGSQRFFWGARQHDLHHQHGDRNYGLYFSFWDRLMGTASEPAHRSEVVVSYP